MRRRDGEPLGHGADALAYASAVEVRERFRAAELSPVELLEALVARAARVEPLVNAFAETLYETARIEAREAEARYRAGTARPLEGLPVAAKEAQALAGHVVSEGLVEPLDPAPAPRTALALQRLRGAGAIVHARTTVSELCCMPMSHASRWGVTRNPWDLSKAVGGSSGGSAAALAAGTAPLATGTDIGGSIRAPACLAGVVGYKPPRGRVPVDPPHDREPWMHVGPLARSVADLAAIAGAMAGTDAESARAEEERLAAPGDAAGLRLGFCPDPGDLPVARAVAANATRVAAALDGAGVRVEPVELDWRLEEINAAMWGHGDLTRARLALARERRRPGQLSPYAVECFERSLAGAVAVSPQLRPEIEQRLAASVESLLERFDALLVPTMGVGAMAAGEDYAERPLSVDGRALDHFCDAALTPIFNIAGACPVISVPSGRVAQDEPGETAGGLPSPGVPTGVQVVGRPGEERTAFSVAAAIERVAPWDFGDIDRPRAAPDTASEASLEGRPTSA